MQNQQNKAKEEKKADKKGDKKGDKKNDKKGVEKKESCNDLEKQKAVDKQIASP